MAYNAEFGETTTGLVVNSTNKDGDYSSAIQELFQLLLAMEISSSNLNKLSGREI